MAQTETAVAFTNLAEKTHRIGLARETWLAVLGVMGIGSTRADISSIVGQPTSQAIQAGLQTNEQVQGVMTNIVNEPTLKGAPTANDDKYPIAA